MAWIKAKDKKELLSLLDSIIPDYLWKEIDRTNNSWGDCLAHTDDYVMLDKEWQKNAKRLKRSLK